MRDDYKKIKGKLYGIGIGPGDPGLVTLRAREILNKVDTIFVPKATDAGTSRARFIAEAVALEPKKFIELVFPMTKDKKKLRSYWLRAAGTIARQLEKGKDAAFITIGDPFIYSTYIYLLETLRKKFPEIEPETVPGISSFNAAASSAGIPLVKGNEKLAVLPVPDDFKLLRQALKEFDTVVLMKIGSKLDKIIRLLDEIKLIKSSALISHAGHPDERIIRDLSSLKDKKAGYLSIIIVKRK